MNRKMKNYSKRLREHYRGISEAALWVFLRTQMDELTGRNLELFRSMPVPSQEQMNRATEELTKHGLLVREDGQGPEDPEGEVRGVMFAREPDKPDQ